MQDYFRAILAVQQAIGYDWASCLQAPAEFEQILAFETKAGFKLNDELLELYACANGTQNPCNSDQAFLIPIHQWLSLESAADYYFAYKDTLASRSALFKEPGGYIPGPNLFPLLEDGRGSCFWVDLNADDEHYGQLFRTNTGGDASCYAFSSLTSLFKTISEAYDNQIISMDPEGWLECDYEDYYALASKNEPTMPCWQKI